MPDFTTIVGVDNEHLLQLQLVWPTWRRHRPQILDRPLLLICDGQQTKEAWRARLSFLDHSNVRIENWNMPGVSQREKMLSGLIFGAAKHVETAWYLKLDTDTIAMEPGDWLQSEWFQPNTKGETPVFVSSPWGYTKPPDAIDHLDAWAKSVPELASHADLEISPLPGWSLVRHKRIISWCFFGRTDWTREMASYCDGRLPVPSQDTYLWYCAKRRGDFYRREKMKNFGWTHVRSTRKIKQLCMSSLST